SASRKRGESSEAPAASATPFRKSRRRIFRRIPSAWSRGSFTRADYSPPPEPPPRGLLQISERAQPFEVFRAQPLRGLAVRLHPLALGPLTPGRELCGELRHDLGVARADVLLVERIVREVVELVLRHARRADRVVHELPAARHDRARLAVVVLVP